MVYNPTIDTDQAVSQIAFVLPAAHELAKECVIRYMCYVTTGPSIFRYMYYATTVPSI